MTPFLHVTIGTCAAGRRTPGGNALGTSINAAGALSGPLVPPTDGASPAT